MNQARKVKDDLEEGEEATPVKSLGALFHFQSGKPNRSGEVHCYVTLNHFMNPPGGRELTLGEYTIALLDTGGAVRMIDRLLFWLSGIEMTEMKSQSTWVKGFYCLTDRLP